MTAKGSFDPFWDEKYKGGHEQRYPWDVVVSFVYRHAPRDRDRSDIRILEVGCGGGHVLRLFPEAALTGVDVSDVFLRKARKNLDGYHVTLRKGQLHELRLEEASFTKAVCTEVLEHVIEPEGILRGLQRVVRPGGTVVITFPNDRLIHRVKNIVRRSGAALWPSFRRISWGADKYHLHVWSIDQMRALLSRFFVIRQEAFAPWASLPLRCCFRCINGLSRSPETDWPRRAR